MWKKVCSFILTAILSGCMSFPTNNNPQVFAQTSQNINSGNEMTNDGGFHQDPWYILMAIPTIRVHI